MTKCIQAQQYESKILQLQAGGLGKAADAATRSLKAHMENCAACGGGHKAPHLAQFITGPQKNLHEAKAQRKMLATLKPNDKSFKTQDEAKLEALTQERFELTDPKPGYAGLGFKRFERDVEEDDAPNRFAYVNTEEEGRGQNRLIPRDANYATKAVPMCFTSPEFSTESGRPKAPTAEEQIQMRKTQDGLIAMTRFFRQLIEGCPAVAVAKALASLGK